MNPAFTVAREIGTSLSQGFNKVKDENAIESILSNAMQSGDPSVLQNSIGKILSSVSPERQGAAIKYLESAYQNVQERQKQAREQAAAKKAGIDPDLPAAIQTLQYKEKNETKQNLKLNEALNQAEKRYKVRINALKTPFEKRDAYGGIFLDFEQDEKKRKEVLGKLDKELKDYAAELKRTYNKYDETAPQDIEDQLKENIKVNVDGQSMSLRLNEKIEEFEKQYPAKKHKGEQTQDDEGNIIVSDGITWKLKE